MVFSSDFYFLLLLQYQVLLYMDLYWDLISVNMDYMDYYYFMDFSFISSTFMLNQTL